jgi:thymidylate synthase (FAD)
MINIIQPSAKMVGLPDRDVGIELLRKVEFCARISHASTDRQTEDSWERFLTSIVLEHGDWSVTNHVHVTVDAVIDRGVSHEWVRHRIGAYTQASTRFINYAKKHTTLNEFINPMAFICPPSIEQCNGDVERQKIFDVWLTSRLANESEYLSYIENGIKPQEARSCLPNALATRLIATYPLNIWRYFFLMRTSVETHPQMRQVTLPLLQEFQAKIPLLYDDIIPEMRQRDNQKKAW